MRKKEYTLKLPFNWYRNNTLHKQVCVIWPLFYKKLHVIGSEQQIDFQILKKVNFQQGGILVFKSLNGI